MGDTIMGGAPPPVGLSFGELKPEQVKVVSRDLSRIAAPTPDPSGPAARIAGSTFLDIFRSCTPYIKMHQGKTMVFHLASVLLDHPKLFDEIMEDVARENTLIGPRLGSAAPPSTSLRSAHTTTATDFEPTISTVDIAGDATDVRPVEAEIGYLVLVRGMEELASARFPIAMGTTRIGRGEDVDVQIPELGVSRLHAEIVIALSGLSPA